MQNVKDGKGGFYIKKEILLFCIRVRVQQYFNFIGGGNKSTW
jgi:hypothetical protein